MKKNILFLIISIFLIGTFFILYKTFFSSKVKNIQINNTKIVVEIKNTPREREKGLSGREKLPENQGMLFIFENQGHHSFWMKEMKFPLDFIWIKDSKIIEITQKVKPEDYQPPNVLVPKYEVNKVLEVNAGFLEKNNIKVGDSIR